MSELEGKTVLIRGAPGERDGAPAIAVAFAKAGADIVATDLVSGGTRNENEEGLEEIRLGGRVSRAWPPRSEGLGRRVVDARRAT